MIQVVQQYIKYKRCPLLIPLFCFSGGNHCCVPPTPMPPGIKRLGRSNKYSLLLWFFLRFSFFHCSSLLKLVLKEIIIRRGISGSWGMCRPSFSKYCQYIGLHSHQVIDSSSFFTSLPKLDNVSHSGEVSYYDFNQCFPHDC